MKMKISVACLTITLLVGLCAVKTEAKFRLRGLLSKGCGFYRKYVGREAPLLDKDGDGRATRSDVAEYLGMDEKDENIDHIMNMMDVKREGSIDAYDFLATLLTSDVDDSSAV